MWPFKPKQSIQIKVIDREVSDLRLSEFRSDANLCKGVAEALRGAYLRVAMDVLTNEHPGNSVLHPNTPMEMRACHQSKCEGYTMAIANLESMARHEQPVSVLESSFDEPEELQLPTNKK